MIVTDPAINILCLIALLTLFCQWFSWWTKLPAILFLLISGIIIGPTLGWLNPKLFFGDLLTPIVSLSVAIILFEGSLTLKRREFSDVRHVVRNLLTFGLVITIVLTALFAHLLLAMDWGYAILLGVITSVTGPTVIVPMLRTVKPSRQVSNILRWEGISVDPIGAILAILVFGLMISINQNIPITHLLLNFGALVVASAVLGIGAGFLFGQVLKRHWLPEYLHNISTLSLVLIVYGIGNLISDGGGLLGVTVMGVTLTNMKNVPIEEILGFKESLSILLISALFIIISAEIQFSYVKSILYNGLLLCLILQFVVRPISVALSTIGSGLSWQERALLAWIAPRGIVAAAVAAILTIKLNQFGYKGSEILFSMTFIIIIFTVVFQSITARFIASILGVAEPEGKGFLIIGANPLALSIASVLVENDFNVQLTTRNWDHAHKARMQNLPVYFGSPVGDHADRHMDLLGVDQLLALSPEADLNALACMRYKNEFGAKSLYSVRIPVKGKLLESSGKTKGPGKFLFGDKETFVKLSSLLAQGAKIRGTLLTENFSFSDYQKQYQNKAILLFAIDPKGKLAIFTEETQVEPTDGWTLIGLTPGEA